MGNIVQKVIRKIAGGGKSAQQAEMEYLIAHGLRVGKNFQSFTDYPFDSNWPWLITVGDNVLISTNVRILAHDASTNYAGTHTKIGIVEIGNDVFIGSGSIILCNTRIGNNVIIGAGSVVSHDVPSDSVVAGNPAKIVCSMREFREKHQKNLKDHVYFNKHRWNEWKDASPDEWAEMRDKLKDTFGYV